MYNYIQYYTNIYKTLLAGIRYFLMKILEEDQNIFLISSSGGTPRAQDKDQEVANRRTRRGLIAPPPSVHSFFGNGTAKHRI